MSKLLYMEDCYLREFDAVVREADGNRVVLDQTAFYPESGGQPSDTGEIYKNGCVYRVVRVYKDKGKVVHELDKPGLLVGDRVKAKIDWDRRYLFMRYHTACHVLSTVIHNVTGAEITGNQIGEERTRIDFSLKEFDREKIQDYVKAANRLIDDARAVRIKMLPREEAFKIPSLVKLRKMLPESIKQVRVVEIEGFDQQACAGTHVANTKEIGHIKVVELKNKGKDNRRVYFVLV